MYVAVADQTLIRTNDIAEGLLFALSNAAEVLFESPTSCSEDGLPFCGQGSPLPRGPIAG